MRDTIYLARNKGFTLVELIIYVALLAVLLMAAVGLLALVLQSRVRSQVIIEVEQQGDQLLYLINQTIRNSEGVNSPLPNASSALLSLNLVDLAKDPTIFQISGGAITIQEGVSTPETLTSSRLVVSDLKFSNYSLNGTPGSLLIEFNLAQVNPDGRPEYNYQKRFYGSASLR